MKEYIIIVNGVVSEYDTLAELKAGLAMIAEIPAKVYTFRKVHDHLYRLDLEGSLGERLEILQRGDDESASDYMDRLKAAGQTEPEFYV